MNNLKWFVVHLILLMFLTIACKKEAANPFDQLPDDEEPNEPGPSLDSTSLAGLHANIFRPTCANSGCHDGTFEPDFRSVSSTYNTLVNHPIIKNDPEGSYQFRVVPGDVEASLLVARLTYDIDDNSGVMPLVIEPDSDWPDKKEDYIRHIKTWIEEGAPAN